MGQDQGQDQGQDRGQDQGQDQVQDQGQDQGQDRGRDRGQDQGQDQGQDLSSKRRVLFSCLLLKHQTVGADCETNHVKRDIPSSECYGIAWFPCFKI